MHSYEGLISAAYVVAAILFILALGGLSGQEKAKRAIWYGIIGMVLAVVATVGPVQTAAVIPDDKHAGVPLVGVLKFVPGLPLVQLRQQRQ